MIFFYIYHVRLTEAAVSECSETAITIEIWEFNVQTSEAEEKWRKEAKKMWEFRFQSWNTRLLIKCMLFSIWCAKHAK